MTKNNKMLKSNIYIQYLFDHKYKITKYTQKYVVYNVCVNSIN